MTDVYSERSQYGSYESREMEGIYMIWQVEKITPNLTRREKRSRLIDRLTLQRRPS